MRQRTFVNIRSLILIEGNIISPDSLIQGRKTPEFGPNPRLLHCGDEIRIKSEASGPHGRKNGTSSIGHQTEFFQSADTLLVELCPRAVFLSWRETLHGYAVDRTDSAVNPPETERLFDGVQIPETGVFVRPPTLHKDPAFRLVSSVFNKPAPKFISVFDVNNIINSFMIFKITDKTNKLALAA